MKPGILRLFVFSALLAAMAASAEVISSQEISGAGRSSILGLDHIPLAVTDLEDVSQRYRQLGFELKPGRSHDNGIRNRHVKFLNGTELELITTREARDPLTREYLRHLASGDGPAFVGFYAPDVNAVARKLDVANMTYRRDGGLIIFPEKSGLRYIFFGHRNSSPTDQPEYFEHPNGAEALIGVWLASDDFAAEHQLLAALGATFSIEEVRVPDRVMATVARLQEAEVVFLPGSRQLVRGRRIIGAIVRTNDRDALHRVLAAGSSEWLDSVQTKARSTFVPPTVTHGIWLEFRE